MAERGVLALCFQAPGETAAALACAALASALASALAAILTATSALIPPHPHPRRPTREGGPPASGWRLVTTRAREVLHCTACWERGTRPFVLKIRSGRLPRFCAHIFAFPR